MKLIQTSQTILLAVLSLGFLLIPPAAQGAILTLEFANGNGTSLVDQYTGASGSGWNTAWTQSFGVNTTSGSAGVVNTTPLYTGGGNYLHVGFDTISGGTASQRSARVSRQWDTSAISLTQPIVLDFYFRSDTVASNTLQSFSLFGSSTATSGTSLNDSWRIDINSTGINAFNNTTSVSLGTAAQTGVNVANTPFHFTLSLDPVADTYVVSVTRLDTNVTFTSGALAFRNGADASLAYLNFVSFGGASQSNLGFSLDTISVVPEPGVVSLFALGGCLVFAFRKRLRS